MRQASLTTYEYQFLSVGEGSDADLSLPEASALMDLGRARPGFSSHGDRSIRLAQYVGLVNLGGRVLEVLPKVGATDDEGSCRGTLLRLLRLAYDLPLFSRGDVGHDLRKANLLDVFVSAFMESLSSLVRAGLLRRYRNMEDDIGVIRGRLNIPRQIAVHAMRPDRLACRFDELTIDNAWNQVLKATLYVVKPWTRSPEAGRRWIELAAAFDEISIPYDALDLLRGLPTDRQVRRYASALHWASWILRLLSPSVRAGSSKAPELLFDMNRLFESAVASRLRQRARARGLRVSTQEFDRYLATGDSDTLRSFFRVRPDIVVRNEACIVSVADTKWSRIKLGSSGALVPADDHVYQLNAYAGVYPTEELVLIYPWEPEHCTAKSTSFCLPEVRSRAPKLHIVCIDVTTDELSPRVSGNSVLGDLLN